MPIVSFIMPTYNRAWIIREAIGSIISQTYQNWELFLVDDGSTDNTAELTRNINDKRIRYYHQKNLGPAVARNKALELVQGEWIAYLDSDNTLLSNYLEVMLPKVLANKTTVFAFPKGHRYLELYRNGQMVKRIDDTSEFRKNITVQDIVHRKLHTDINGLMHSRRIIEDGIRFDEHLQKLEDWELLLTLCERYPNGFMYIDELLYSYHQRFGGDGVITNSTYGEWADIFEYIYQKHNNDTLMAGQDWYPDRVQKWKKLDEEHKNGLIPPYPLWYFKENWPEQKQK